MFYQLNKSHQSSCLKTIPVDSAQAGIAFSIGIKSKFKLDHLGGLYEV
jgi:hypothetical protein